MDVDIEGATFDQNTGSVSCCDHCKMLNRDPFGIANRKHRRGYNVAHGSRSFDATAFPASLNLDVVSFDDNILSIKPRQYAHLSPSRRQRVHRILNPAEIPITVRAVTNSVRAATFHARERQKRRPAIIPHFNYRASPGPMNNS